MLMANKNLMYGFTKQKNQIYSQNEKKFNYFLSIYFKLFFVYFMYCIGIKDELRIHAHQSRR